MRVTIRSPHVTLEDSEREHLSEAVKHALAHVESRVTSVQVHVADLNGPKGGVDKQCELVANCGKLGVLRTDATAGEIRAAGDKAVAKLRRAVEHAVDHKRGERKARAPHRRTEK
ncbi:MAG: HPF/RaiA family ribosome-associated protein [Planctomycetes bacterium]|nr:HPF/RaiA family ribosome-associated protein [Planctomycetota bacterium]